jgi:NACalpha-BTF3-like transcription factor
MLFVLSAPEVFKSNNSDCYIVFGEPKVRILCLLGRARAHLASQMEDMNQQQMAAAQGYGGGGGGMPTLDQSGLGGGDDDDDDVPELEPAEDEGPVDETGVEAKDIELVMQQVSCSRAKAVKALKDSGGDLINASAYMCGLCPNEMLIVVCSHGRKRVTKILPSFVQSSLFSRAHCSSSFSVTRRPRSYKQGLLPEMISFCAARRRHPSSST